MANLCQNDPSGLVRGTSSTSPQPSLGGSAYRYQTDRRDVGSRQTGGRLNMQPSGLMNIYASPSCPENARSCRCGREDICIKDRGRELGRVGGLVGHDVPPD